MIEEMVFDKKPQILDEHGKDLAVCFFLYCIEAAEEKEREDNAGLSGP